MEQIPPLNETEVRVLAALVEKESTTPEYYPLSLNALTLACNQKNNRDPVVAYSDDTVSDALDSLRSKKLARSAAGGRVVKYEHSFLEVLNLGRRELALLCTLMLRGPQTVGELRDRSERMRAFSDLEEVEACLDGMIGQSLVKRLPRQPGAEGAALHCNCWEAMWSRRRGRLRNAPRRSKSKWNRCAGRSMSCARSSCASGGSSRGRKKSTLAANERE